MNICTKASQPFGKLRVTINNNLCHEKLNQGLYKCLFQKRKGKAPFKKSRKPWCRNIFPLSKKLVKKVCRSFACRKYSTLLISARGRIKHGINQHKRYRDQRLSECRNM